MEIGLTSLRRGQRGIFVEVYFPRRVTAQGTIFKALEDGYKEENVKDYLLGNLPRLLQEFREAQQVFHPDWYGRRKRKDGPTVEDGRKRIDMYKSSFFGWSNYVVDGVFFGEGGKMIEEATQIIRLLFQFEGSFGEKAAQANCQDVLRAILFWVITQQGRLDDVAPWNKSEENRFLRDHAPMPRRKREFIREYFEPITRQAFKWRGDCFLFIFGYLVRQFSERLKELGHPEEEIWVTSFFNLTVSVLKKATP
jgi:hypothetical protein